MLQSYRYEVTVVNISPKKKVALQKRVNINIVSRELHKKINFMKWLTRQVGVQNSNCYSFKV